MGDGDARIGCGVGGGVLLCRHGGAGTGHAPLRTIRTIVNEVLAPLDTEFEALYEGIGRQSVAPERLLRLTVAGILLCVFRALADGADQP
jgi:hypothetical protein